MVQCKRADIRRCKLVESRNPSSTCQHIVNPLSSSAAAADPAALIQIRGLHFAYATQSVFTGVDIEIPRKKVTVILGPSGCGKSTLLNFIGGRLRPDLGDVVVDGLRVPGLSQVELYQLRQRIGMLFQSSALLTDMSVFDNVAFPLREHTKLHESLIRTIVLMKLELVGLRGARHLRPAQLSGGMARRVALARAIALDPMVVLYDEPFAGLDPISMGVIVKLIRELNDALGMTSVVVTHDVVEACTIADYIFLLGNRKVIGQGAPAEMRHSDSEEVRQFMGGLPDGPVPYHHPATDYGDELLAQGDP